MKTQYILKDFNLLGHKTQPSWDIEFDTSSLRMRLQVVINTGKCEKLGILEFPFDFSELQVKIKY